MSQEQPARPRTKYVDRPEVSEIFVDGYEMMFFDGTSLRLEFTIARYDQPKPPKTRTGQRHTACRLVLTPDAAVALYNSLSKLVAALEERGAVKREPV